MASSNKSEIHGSGLKLVSEKPLQYSIQYSNEQSFILFDINNAIGSLTYSNGRLKLSDLKDILPGALNAEPSSSVYLSEYDRIVEQAEGDAHPEANLTCLGEAFKFGLSRHPILVDLPSAFTYFGQFIGHDISRLQVIEEPFSDSNLNTAAFDLDSVFFPTIEAKKLVDALKDAGNFVASGVALGRIGDASKVFEDLPRIDGTAIIPDSRNDSNATLAQFHVAVIKFYLSLIQNGEKENIARAKTIVSLHDIALNDYLPRIIDPFIYRRVCNSGREVISPGSGEPGDDFLISIEFSAALYRFGHSMIRPGYNWSKSLGIRNLDAILARTGFGGEELTKDWVLDWNRFIESGSKDVNYSLLANASLTKKLTKLQRKFFDGETGTEEVNLAERTLLRGNTLNLPSAQTLYAHIKDTTSVFDDDRFLLLSSELEAAPSEAIRTALNTKENGAANSMLDRTPLWYYCLAEARAFHGGQRLGPLTSRVIMETIHAAVHAGRERLKVEFGHVSFGKLPCTLSEFLAQARAFSPKI